MKETKGLIQIKRFRKQNKINETIFVGVHSRLCVKPIFEIKTRGSLCYFHKENWIQSWLGKPCKARVKQETMHSNTRKQ